MSKSKEFGDKLKKLLEEKNITQNELADKIKVGKSSLSMYITGKQLPRWEVLTEIANILNVTTDYLLYDNDKSVDSDINEIAFIPVFSDIKFSDDIDDPNNKNIVRYIPVAAERFKNCNTLFFKKVNTDEMNPRIMKGDLILFELLRTGVDKIYTGDICLCTKSDEPAVIRELVTTSNGYVFNLMNVSMPPRPKTLEKIKEENINIIARAIELLHEFPDRSKM